MQTWHTKTKANPNPETQNYEASVFTTYSDKLTTVLLERIIQLGRSIFIQQAQFMLFLKFGILVCIFKSINVFDRNQLITIAIGNEPYAPQPPCKADQEVHLNGVNPQSPIQKLGIVNGHPQLQGRPRPMLRIFKVSPSIFSNWPLM